MRLGCPHRPQRARRRGAALLALAVLVAVPAATTSSQAPTAAPISGGATATAVASRLRQPFDTNQFLRTTGNIPSSSASEPSGAFRFLCNMSHLANDDPIVYPGQRGASHLHMFFGNTVANALSTYPSLRSFGGGSCQGGPINRTAYWAPALFNAQGMVMAPDFISVYYKGTNGSASSIQNMKMLANGLKMIAGYNMTAPGGDTHFNWYCEQTQIKAQTIPNCPAGERVGVTVVFPQCWDGVNTDSADHRSHMAYVVYPQGRVQCPATHPVLVPEVTVGIWYANDGNSANWYLSSDRMPDMTHANGSTFHSDWFGAWEPAIQDRWMANCINALRSCSGGQLGDGSELTPLPPYGGPKVMPAL